VISKVVIDQSNRSMEVVVPDDQLSLAIGKRGQNVRLASKLTNWRLDVTGESRYERLRQAGYQSLLNIPGLTVELADSLYDVGINSLEEFLSAGIDELMEVTHLQESVLTTMLLDAQQQLTAEAEMDAVRSDEEQSSDAAVQE